MAAIVLGDSAVKKKNTKYKTGSKNSPNKYFEQHMKGITLTRGF